MKIEDLLADLGRLGIAMGARPMPPGDITPPVIGEQGYVAGFDLRLIDPNTIIVHFRSPRAAMALPILGDTESGSLAAAVAGLRFLADRLLEESIAVERAAKESRRLKIVK
ncbi:MAG: hypothetical protein A3E78_13930 [Alphaproteobacteria bacterium RIFCSPHIGHO2_12_FULL_63_12]|nr:MAG: hypothetical protein A3E78_13930 [Alphaproteobacteria bacterium RIFCSPHIGHO2_12_FULL_63_12]